MRTFLMVTLFICLISGSLTWVMTKANAYEGTEIEFNFYDSRYLLIETQGEPTVTLEAQSNDYFAIENSASGEILSAKKTEKPLGWDGDFYYLEPSEVSEGKWELVAGNNLSVKLVSENETQLRLKTYQQNQAIIFLLISLVGLLINFLIWVFLNQK